MDAIFRVIEESEFIKLSIPILFNDKRTGRCFGLISCNSKSYKLSWQSDIVKPVLTYIDKGIYGVGIDLHFAVIDFNYNTILLNLKLFYNFYDAKIFKEWVFVISELEVIKISRIDFNIKERHELPDFFEKIEFKESRTEIKCLGDEIIIIS